jgi:broad specificity phosphatase PhoE
MNEKHIIVLRHGERSDYAGLIPKLNRYDPELTDKGKKQALLTGELIKSHFGNMHDLKIAALCSPFARTIQTAKNVIDAMGLNHDILIDNSFSEYINHSFDNNHPINFLTVYNKIDELREDLGSTNLVYLDEKLPVFENEEMVKDRIIKSLYRKVEKYFINENYDAIFIFTHGTPVNILNQELKFCGPFGMDYIKYCHTYIYKFVNGI